MEFDGDFLTSWKPGKKLNTGAALDLGDSPPRKTSKKLNLPNFDMDLDGGFNKLSSFKIDLSGLDLSPPSKPKEAAPKTKTNQVIENVGSPMDFEDGSAPMDLEDNNREESCQENEADKMDLEDMHPSPQSTLFQEPPNDMEVTTVNRDTEQKHEGGEKETASKADDFFPQQTNTDEASGQVNFEQQEETMVENTKRDNDVCPPKEVNRFRTLLHRSTGSTELEDVHRSRTLLHKSTGSQQTTPVSPDNRAKTGEIHEAIATDRHPTDLDNNDPGRPRTLLQRSQQSSTPMDLQDVRRSSPLFHRSPCPPLAQPEDTSTPKDLGPQVLRARTLLHRSTMAVDDHQTGARNNAENVSMKPSSDLGPQPSGTTQKNVEDKHLGAKTLENEVTDKASMSTSKEIVPQQAPVAVSSIHDTCKTVVDNEIIIKADKCAKELDDMYKMLKHKHEEAKELLVRALVTNNQLLILNSPVTEEKVLKHSLGELLSREQT